VTKSTQQFALPDTAFKRARSGRTRAARFPETAHGERGAPFPGASPQSKRRSGGGIVEAREVRTGELVPLQDRVFGGSGGLGGQKYQTRMAPTLTESAVKSSGTETKTSSKGITLPPLE